MLDHWYQIDRHQYYIDIFNRLNGEITALNEENTILKQLVADKDLTIRQSALENESLLLATQTLQEEVTELSAILLEKDRQIEHLSDRTIAAESAAIWDEEVANVSYYGNILD